MASGRGRGGGEEQSEASKAQKRGSQWRRMQQMTVRSRSLRVRDGHAAFDLLGFAAGGVDEEGDADADEVEDKHGAGEEAHADGVRRGADDGGDEEDDQDGVADVLEEELAVDDAEEGEEEDEDGQLEADAEAEDDGEEEAGVVLDGDDGVEALAEVEDEDLDGAGQDPAVAEPGAGEEEADGGAHEGEDVFLLVGVHAGRDEEPDLVEDEGAGEDGAADEGGLEVEVEASVGWVIVERDVEVVERASGCSRRGARGRRRRRRSRRAR